MFGNAEILNRAAPMGINVHASENFYGAPGSTDMAGPQSFLANEADRLWVTVYDGFSRMAVPLFMLVSAFLLAPMGINVISSLSPFTASSSGNTPHSPVSSIFHSGTGRPIAFTSKGTLATVKG